MTVTFFNISGGPGSAKGVGQTSNTQKSAKTEAKGEAKFSATLENATATQTASKTQDAERAQRIEELKAQVQDGSYNPDLKKVAASLAEFMARQNG